MIINYQPADAPPSDASESAAEQASPMREDRQVDGDVHNHEQSSARPAPDVPPRENPVAPEENAAGDEASNEAVFLSPMAVSEADNDDDDGDQ